MVKESVKLRLFKRLCRIIHFKDMFKLPEEKLLPRVIKANKGLAFKIPNDNQFIYNDVVIMEKHHCLRMQKEKTPSNKALLYLFGGGFIRGCGKSAVEHAKGLGERSGRDIWLPYYPLCTDYCITETYAMVYQTYKEMLKVYSPENIAIAGFSAGGALALGLGCHINAQKENIPMPGVILASSPGSVPSSEEEINKMRELNPLDVMLDEYFITVTLKKVMTKGQTVPDYMIHTSLGDFSNFPKTHVCFASHECLYAMAENIEKALQKYHVDYEMHIKEGAFHCYHNMTFYPEGKEGSAELDSYLK